MNAEHLYDLWRLPFLTELNGNYFLRALLGLAHELGLLRQVPCPSPATHVQTAESSLAVTISGGADAFGIDTFASADVSMLVVDRGLAQCTAGSAAFVAVAEGSEQDPAFASAYAQVEILGADLSSVSEGHVSSSDATSAVDVACVQFAAIDLVFAWTAGCGPDDVFADSASDPTTDVDVLEGNLATFDVTATAFGEDTFVSVVTDAIAVEDALSSVVVSATAAVDADFTYKSTEGTARADTIAMSGQLTVCHGRGGDDRISGAAGIDWIFGDQGADRLSGGGGDDNLFGGTQSDQLAGGAGNDWIFGGHGSDKMSGDAGDDLLFGNEDADQINGGAGADIISGGKGADGLNGDAGDDWFQLGAPGGDGNDKLSGGAGVDHYLIQGDFDKDLISDFSISQGDRLVFSADAEDPLVAMQRGGKDLIVSFSFDDHHDQLTLGNFFGINSGFQGMSKMGALSDAQVATLLDMITASPEDLPTLHLVEQTLTIGDMLAGIG